MPSPRLRVLVVASEASPFAKTGGLADVAGSPLAEGLGLDVDVEGLPEPVGDLEHRDALAAPDVQHLPGRSVGFERQPARAGDVEDGDEVAPLAAVLEDKWRPAIQEP